jgi:2-amino-4-hydroxy-6-hydroxymethyldihydropteridine diphosphokinase
VKIAIALGSNLGDSRAILEEARNFLKNLSQGEFRFSSLYRTAPIDCPPGSPDFLNAAALIEWNRDLNELLNLFQKYEKDLGRPESRPKNSPRPLDLDILFADQLISHDPTLTIPHPRMKERLFVLEPLAEICPDFIFPDIRQTMRDVLNEARQKFPEQLAFVKENF